MRGVAHSSVLLALLMHVCSNMQDLWRMLLLQVGKLAKKLPVGDVKAMATQLGGTEEAAAAVVDTSDINEEDLT